jgi:hypothetical protein
VRDRPVDEAQQIFAPEVGPPLQELACRRPQAGGVDPQELEIALDVERRNGR